MASVAAANSKHSESAQLHQKAAEKLSRSKDTAEKIEEFLAEMIVNLRQAKHLEDQAADALAEEREIWQQVEKLGGPTARGRVQGLVDNTGEGIRHGLSGISNKAGQVLDSVKNFGQGMMGKSHETADNARKGAENLRQGAEDLYEKTKESVQPNWEQWKPYFDSTEWKDYFKAKSQDEADWAKDQLARSGIDPTKWRDFVENTWESAKAGEWPPRNAPEKATSWIRSLWGSSDKTADTKSWLPSLGTGQWSKSPSISSGSSSGSDSNARAHIDAPVSLLWSGVSLIYLWWLVKRVNRSRELSHVYVGDGALELSQEFGQDVTAEVTTRRKDRETTHVETIGE
jgi:hypothetical protein